MTKPDCTAEIALHEAAHCVAMHLEGLKIDKVRVSESDGSVMPASKPSGDPFGHAVSLLAANAFMRSLGRPDDGDSNDFVRASFLVAMQFDDRTEAAKEAFSIVCEATSALVRTPRFIDLATALAPKLAKGYLHLGSEVERFLRSHDSELTEQIAQAHSWRSEAHAAWPPTAPVSRHMHHDGTVTLYSNGRLLISRASREAVDRRARQILG